MAKIGTEILVNTQKTFDQTLSQSAKLNNGGFVVVWVDWADSPDPTVADGSWSAIKAQVFSPAGSKVGAEILVNTATLLWQQDPRVAVLPGGNFVVSWTDGWDYFGYADHNGSQGVGGATGDTEGKAVKLQVFSAGGNPVGTEVLVNTEPRNHQTGQKIAALANGNFVVTWEDWVSSCAYDANGNLDRCGGGPEIKAQLFDPAGAKIGNALLVTGDHNYAPQITALTDGGFAIAWHDGHYSVDDVRAQVFGATGARVGSEILVNTAGAGASWSSQNEEQIAALADGRFVLAWTDNNGDDSSSAVKARVFDAAGLPISEELLVNTGTFSYQWHPRIAVLKNGGFVVAWDTWGADGPDATSLDVNAQIFDNAGARVGKEIVLNTSTAGAQGTVQVTALDDGGFAASWWDSNGAWSGYAGAPRFQVFDATGTKVGAEQLANTTPAVGGASPITVLDDGTFLLAWSSSDDSGTAVKAQIFDALPDQMLGTAGKDVFSSTTGNDTVDGLAGTDTVQFAGARSNYAVARSGSGWTVDSPAQGTDTLTSIERLHFPDAKLALDLGPADAAGQALEFIGLMAPSLTGTPSIVGQILALFDNGSSMQGVCQLALDVGLVNAIAGSGSNAALAAMAYRNVVGAEAGADMVDVLVGYMDGRNASYSQAEFMATIAGLELNQVHIGLVGLQQTGVEFA